MKTVDRGVESREAGSLRPECGRAGEPRSRRPGSGRTAGKGARSAKSRLVRLRGPAENQKVCFISGAQRAQSFRVKNIELRSKKNILKPKRYFHKRIEILKRKNKRNK